ncbi:hypothetical protein C8R45DRAFT_1137597 [Mycena sanguinolenta]|nr:hypothetical protein C8R45DRAFT_1137597 [Mycena sanguinolenta]
MSAAKTMDIDSGHRHEFWFNSSLSCRQKKQARDWTQQDRITEFLLCFLLERKKELRIERREGRASTAVKYLEKRERERRLAAGSVEQHSNAESPFEARVQTGTVRSRDDITSFRGGRTWFKEYDWIQREWRQTGYFDRPLGVCACGRYVQEVGCNEATQCKSGKTTTQPRSIAGVGSIPLAPASGMGLFPDPSYCLLPADNISDYNLRPYKLFVPHLETGAPGMRASRAECQFGRREGKNWDSLRVLEGRQLENMAWKGFDNIEREVHSRARRTA